MNLYVTTSEIKTFIGISGSTHDALLAMLNKQATSMVNGILSVSDMALHKVTNEKPTIIKAQTLVLNDRPIQKVGTIDEDGTAYTQTDDYDIDSYIVKLENYLTTDPRYVTVDYAAGYNAAGMAYIDIVDYTGLSTDTVTIDGNTVTEGTDWNAATDNATTATNLASALNDVSGIRAFAVDTRVYVIDDTVQSTSKTISAGDTTNMTLSSSALDTLDFPEDIRMAVFLMVSDLFERRKNPRLQSYTIGSKTVQFTNRGTFDLFRDALKAHKVSKVHSI